jgi:hypothetical protein
MASVVASEFVPEHMAAVSSSTQSLKIWQVWPGSHYFCCDGRVMVGPDFGVTLFAFTLTTTTSVGFWIFVCPSLPLIFLLIGVQLYVQTVAFMAATATTDPGIVPRCARPDTATAAQCGEAQRARHCASRRCRLPTHAVTTCAQQPQYGRGRGRRVRSVAAQRGGERRARTAQVVPHVPYLPAATCRALLRVQRVRREVRPPLPVDGPVHRTA